MDWSKDNLKFSIILLMKNNRSMKYVKLNTFTTAASTWPSQETFPGVHWYEFCLLHPVFTSIHICGQENQQQWAKQDGSSCIVYL